MEASFNEKKPKKVKNAENIYSGVKKKFTFGDLLLILFFIAAIFATLAPMLNLLARSFSDATALTFNRVSLWPLLSYRDAAGDLSFGLGMQFDAYIMIFRDSAYVRSLWYTAVLTIVAAAVSMTLTILCAFPLTYDNLRGRKIFSVFMILTMYFSAGLIPFFLLLRDLSLLNTFWVLVIPNALSVFNIIVMRAFFFNIPGSLKESAEVEGANPLQVLIRIYLPLSKPVLATLTLFYAVGRWNGFADARMFIDAGHSHLHPIQFLLWRLLQAQTNIEMAAMEGFATPDWGGLTQALRAATVMIATVPILLLYPNLQKYFISGFLIGGVKE